MDISIYSGKNNIPARQTGGTVVFAGNPENPNIYRGIGDAVEPTDAVNLRTLLASLPERGFIEITVSDLQALSDKGVGVWYKITNATFHGGSHTLMIRSTDNGDGLEVWGYLHIGSITYPCTYDLSRDKVNRFIDPVYNNDISIIDGSSKNCVDNFPIANSKFYNVKGVDFDFSKNGNANNTLFNCIIESDSVIALRDGSQISNCHIEYGSSIDINGLWNIIGTRVNASSLSLTNNGVPVCTMNNCPQITNSTLSIIAQAGDVSYNNSSFVEANWNVTSNDAGSDFTDMEIFYSTFTATEQGGSLCSYMVMKLSTFTGIGAVAGHYHLLGAIILSSTFQVTPGPIITNFEFNFAYSFFDDCNNIVLSGNGDYDCMFVMGSTIDCNTYNAVTSDSRINNSAVVWHVNGFSLVANGSQYTNSSVTITSTDQNHLANNFENSNVTISGSARIEHSVISNNTVSVSASINTNKRIEDGFSNFEDIIDIATSSQISIPYNTLVGGPFTGTVTDGTTGATGTVVSDSGSVLVLQGVDGIFGNGDAISDGGGTSAVVNGAVTYGGVNMTGKEFLGIVNVTSANANELITSIAGTIKHKVSFRPAAGLTLFFGNNSDTAGNIFINSVVASPPSAGCIVADGNQSGYVDVDIRGAIFIVTSSTFQLK